MSNSTRPPGPHDYHVLELNVLYGVTSLLSGVVGFIGNLILLRIFFRSSKSLSSKIFLTIALNDIVSSVFGAVPFSIPRLLDGNAGLYQFKALCNLCGMMLNISERYSVFLIAMLSFTRAWVLKYPLFRIPKTRVVVVMGFYAVVQLALACVPFYKNHTYQYHPIFTLCTWSIDVIVDRAVKPLLYQTLYYSFLVVPFLVPSVVVVVSCGFCVASIRKSGVAFKDRNKSRATVTVVIFTLTYIVLHVPLWIFMIIFLVDNHGTISALFYTTTPIYLFMFSSKVSVFLNAALNPIIYIGRVARSNNTGFRTDMSRAASRVTILKKTIRGSRGHSPLVRSQSEMPARATPLRLAPERGLSMSDLDRRSGTAYSRFSAPNMQTLLKNISPGPKLKCRSISPLNQ